MSGKVSRLKFRDLSTIYNSFVNKMRKITVGKYASKLSKKPSEKNNNILQHIRHSVELLKHNSYDKL